MKQENTFCIDLSRMIVRDIDFKSMPSLVRGLEVRPHEKVLFDITVLYGGSGAFVPKFGFLEQDIVIGKPLAVTKNLGSYFYRAKSKREVFQPEIVLEIKYGEVTTHQLITYSQIAAKIKSVFPRCRYYLVLGYCSVTIFEKVMRHGTFFDQIFNLCARPRGQKNIQEYTSGKLERDLMAVPDNNKVYRNLVVQIKNNLSSIKIDW